MHNFTIVEGREKTNFLSLIIHSSFDKMPNIKQRNYNLQAEHKVAQVDKVAKRKTKFHVTHHTFLSE